MLQFYGYKNCDSCRKAEKALKARNVPYEFVDITETPPSLALLSKVQKNSGLDVKKFLNTSGEAYRALGLKDKLPGMTDKSVLELLAEQGRLIKRPFITDGQTVTLGLKDSDNW